MAERVLVLVRDNVLIAAAANSPRSLVMVLEQFDPKEIPLRELATGALLVLRLDVDSAVAERGDPATEPQSGSSAGLDSGDISLMPPYLLPSRASPACE